MQATKGFSAGEAGSVLENGTAFAEGHVFANGGASAEKHVFANGGASAKGHGFANSWASAKKQGFAKSGASAKEHGFANGGASAKGHGFANIVAFAKKHGFANIVAFAKKHGFANGTPFAKPRRSPAGKRKIFLLTTLSLLAAGLFFCAAVNIYVCVYASPYICRNPQELPPAYTVIVPGAKVYSDTVSHVVRDRLEAAVNLVNLGKAERYLLSGDHGQKNYDEVNGMKNFMLRVYAADQKDIFLDHAGFSTYETMYRARDIFLVRDAVIVTQAEFAPRTAYLARKLGLEATVYCAPNLVRYSSRVKMSWQLREVLARVKAFFDVAFRVKPTYLGEQIPISGEASLSWD